MFRPLTCLNTDGVPPSESGSPGGGITTAHTVIVPMCATASADTPRLCVYSAASYLLCNQSHSGESRHLERVKASLQSDAYIRLPASNMTLRRQRDRPGRSTLGLHVTILRLPSSSRLDRYASATLQLWTSDGVMTDEFIDTDHVKQPVLHRSV